MCYLIKADVSNGVLKELAHSMSLFFKQIVTNWINVNLLSILTSGPTPLRLSSFNDLIKNFRYQPLTATTVNGASSFSHCTVNPELKPIYIKECPVVFQAEGHKNGFIHLQINLKSRQN